jgi:hypothetical protein
MVLAMFPVQMVMKALMVHLPPHSLPTLTLVIGPGTESQYDIPYGSNVEEEEEKGAEEEKEEEEKGVEEEEEEEKGAEEEEEEDTQPRRLRRCNHFYLFQVCSERSTSI